MPSQDPLHGVKLRSLMPRALLAGAVCLAWIWYESSRHADIITITRQQPGVAMDYWAGVAEGGFQVGMQGMKGAIGGFRLGPPGWSFSANRNEYPAAEFFPAPALDLRHPENGGLPVAPGAVYSAVFVPAWLVFVFYLAGWTGFTFWRKRGRGALGQTRRCHSSGSAVPE